MSPCTYDVLIVGAGLAGATSARTLAEAGKKVLILERRSHIGGNAYDCLDEVGVLIHQYGPHIFHTAKEDVFTFLSRFTPWLDYQHKVVASIPTADGRVEMPVPFNLLSLEVAFGKEEASKLEQDLIAAYGAEKKVTILELRQNPDPRLSALANYVYDHVFVNYTVKQWGLPPESIDPATTARVPVFLSRDCRYFQDPYQGMPKDGYTPMFANMLDHPNITLQLNTDAKDHLTLTKEGTMVLDGVPFEGEVIYTGEIDGLFDHCHGPLPYRTLDFLFETHNQDQVQSHGTVNYTVDQDYTRITEFKHLTGQVLPHVTTTVKEYSRAYTGAPEETPYYAIINPENNALYQRYRTMAEGYSKLHMLGRLAEYQYYNMDAIVARGLTLSAQLLQGGSHV